MGILGLSFVSKRDNLSVHENTLQEKNNKVLINPSYLTMQLKTPIIRLLSSDASIHVISVFEFFQRYSRNLNRLISVNFISPSNNLSSSS